MLKTSVFSWFKLWAQADWTFGGSGLGLIGLYWGSTIFPIHTSPSLYSRVPPPPPRNKLSMHVCQVGGLSFDVFFTGNLF